ncbi:hypothetical protein DBV05_g3880 [Lasiodiplodia theobromae]|uniref:Acriflavine sensitivity control protein acr-2 n=1 Tax=Lasiodiplodia theobromae TaxID=45133 RepID=A0A5N5DI40_9PEZI|nr:hypothetical protein DBV05_g3880 [Lasiodiplodia theobromae]
MHHFGTQTAPVLFPLAPQAFTQRLVSAALHTPHLLHALLASACSHHARLVAAGAGSNASSHPSSGSRTAVPEAALKFTYLAVAGLRAAMADPGRVARAETAMTAMALCTNDVCDGIDAGAAGDGSRTRRWWRVHLSGVRELLNALILREREEARGKRGSSATVVDDSFAGFLARWFATMDTVARVSGFEGAEDPDDSGCWALVEEMGAGERHYGMVDEFCGYRMELMPIMVRIGRLARSTQREEMVPSVYADGDVGEQGDAANHCLSQEARQIEADILSLAHSSNHENGSHGEQKARELRSTNMAFFHASLLHLHRRVTCLPKDHAKVREDISNILSAVNDIPRSSTANILVLWPIFSAGCETDEIWEQEIINSRMLNMQILGMGNYTRARQVLLDYWSSSSPLRWDIYLQKSGLDLVLF